MERVLNIGTLAWEHPPGFDDGIDQIVLLDSLDQQKKQGVRTRIVRFGPGAFTQVAFLHNYEEEVYLLEGDQSQSMPDGTQARHEKGAYFIRPAGTSHGPFSSENGCLLFEIHYYKQEERHERT